MRIKVVRNCWLFAVMMLDLDNFEESTIFTGHISAQAHHPRQGVLQTSQNRISSVALEAMSLLFCCDVRNKQYASAVVNGIKVVGTLSHQAGASEETSEEEEKQFEISISIGLCFYPEDGNDAVTLITQCR